MHYSTRRHNQGDQGPKRTPGHMSRDAAYRSFLGIEAGEALPRSIGSGRG